MATFSRGKLTMVRHISIVVFGASGDLARKKTFPALYRLFHHGALPPNKRALIVGFARSSFTRDEFHRRIRESVGAEADEKVVDKFLDVCDYIKAEDGYGSEQGYMQLNQWLERAEKRSAPADESHGDGGARSKALRIYYMALPPNQYELVATMLRKYAWPSSNTHTTLLLLEKPYGSSLATAYGLSRELNSIGLSDQRDVHIVDHYLGKDILRQTLALRFSSASLPLATMFHRDVVRYVTLEFKESFGAEGRGGYFDEFGIVRDVMENHLMHILAFSTMEKPSSMAPEALIGARLDLLRCIRPVGADDVVLGQYVTDPSDPKKKGYHEDETVKDDSKTPTYACCRLFIDNTRWRGVPFILQAGKGLDEDRVELTLHFHPLPDPLLRPDEVLASSLKLDHGRLVLQDKPDLRLELHTAAKHTGAANVKDLVPATLVLPFRDLYGQQIGESRNEAPPYEESPYEYLFRAAMEGDDTWFVGKNEAEEQWRVWEKYLEVEGKKAPLNYVYGSRGPKEVEKRVERWINEATSQHKEE